MFAIAAINDTDSRTQCEQQSLAPSKEAQEFHLSQTYHEGLLKLEAKDFAKAQELLEAVLKDPLVSNAQVDNNASDSHLVQLRFLALKNLASVFLGQGCTHHESALSCYLQAVEIDTKDSVIWNQLGTLSCSMGLLSISRWAFEQGLICSPNNWSCMEKLLEVLIAIGDEVTCLSVSEMILRHWPTHSRALQVKNTIEESDPIPFAPKGIDKLEPKHIRLTFPEKRKAENDLENGESSKKLKRVIEIDLLEASWIVLASKVMEILCSDMGSDEYRSVNDVISIKLAQMSENIPGSAEKKKSLVINSCEKMSDGEKEAAMMSQERRSSRLRNRKPDKEECNFSTTKEPAKVVMQYLGPFLVHNVGPDESIIEISSFQNQPESEYCNVTKFVETSCRNYGAYHMGHLILEEIASKGILYQEGIDKLLELEKLTRQWGQDRTSECNLFLAEIYYDFSLLSLSSDFTSEASYHLCKIIESVALKSPYNSMGLNGQQDCKNDPFWVRFFWLSGKLSLLDGDRTKAKEEFNVSLSLLTKGENMENSISSVCLPHCKAITNLSVDRVLHEINLLEVDLMLKRTVPDLIEKKMYLECVNMLSPHLFSAKDVYVNGFCDLDKESVEISALDVLIKACEQMEPMNFEVYLNCHRRKLQILMVTAKMESGSKVCNGSDIEVEETQSNQYYQLVAVEVKAISQCASRIKGIINSCEDSNGFAVPMTIIGDIQSLLLGLICNISGTNVFKKSCNLVMSDQIDQTQKSNFIDVIIAFCKLQSLNPNVPVKIQMELVVSTHNMLAEFGLCCASGDGDEEEGTFLKLAIKHLLALHMKLKTVSHSSNKLLEMNEMDLDQNNGDIVNDSEEEKRITDESYKEKENMQLAECEINLTEEERDELELGIDNALDQCFHCLYGLNLRSDSSYEDDLAVHKNTSRGDYQTKEQCADVLQYILPYAKASSKTGLVKLRRVLRAIRKHFPQPPDEVLAGNAIEKFLDDPDLCEDKLSEEAGSDSFLDSIMKMIFTDQQQKSLSAVSSDPYLEVYCNLYYLLAQSEETSATDKWAGYVLTEEGEDFIAQNTNLSKYDLLYNPQRLESWQRLANIFDEEVDLLLNDGSKQINVLAWRKNSSLPQRVEASRRRSRRCLLMTLALAKTPVQQGEIHELLALVYYDGLQNVVPIFDQRATLPSKDALWMKFCQNSLRHFKKALAHKEDWSHAYYLGKLCEKLGYSYDMSFSYYAKAISMNPSAVDPFYRMHASRLKLLSTCGKQNKEAIKIIAEYCYSQSTKDTALKITESRPDMNESGENINVGLCKLEEVWDMLYSDCISALETCVEGDLKHFHKARYMLAQGLYKRGNIGDLDKAKEELSFCFKSSRSSFTINMWEIDSTVKKGRRKAPGLCGTRKVLEVHLPESSRKFITCIRKYILFYLKLLEETGDITTLERAYTTLRTDKRFSLCLEDLVPLAFGRYIKALISSILQKDCTTLEQLLEKLFALFLEQVNLWSDVCSLPETKCPELTEITLYGYLCQHVQLLEKSLKVEALEAINEKIRKRLKNPKLSSSNCAKVYKHVSLAWCRSLVISMALITPLHSKVSSELQVKDSFDSESDSTQLLCVDLQSDELWNSSFEDQSHLKNLEIKWNPTLNKIKNVIIKKVSDEDLENANMLVRSTYNFYKDTSCALLPSGINLYMVPSQLATETYIQPGIEGVDILDMNTSRKLVLWAYTLLHGHCANISVAIKYCEEITKSKIKKGAGSSSTPISAPHTGGGKDGSSKSCGFEGPTKSAVSLAEASSSIPESGNMQNLGSDVSPKGDKSTHKISEKQETCESESRTQTSVTSLEDKHKSLLDNNNNLHLLRCNNTGEERSDVKSMIDIDLNN